MRNQAHFLLTRSCALGKLVNTQTKGITLLYKGKIIFVSVAFLMALSICFHKSMPYFEISVVTHQLPSDEAI